MNTLTPKQLANRKYYSAHREEILIQKKKYAADHREEVNARQRARNRKPGRSCYICGGSVITDGDVWSCLNPDCEADFIEVEA